MQSERVTTKEREISLIDLIVEILLRWRVIVIAMLVGGILLGGFSYIKSIQTAKAQQAQLEAQEQLLAEQKEQEEQLSAEELEEWQNANRQQLEEALTETQIANVNYAIMYEQFCEEKEAYQKEAAVMLVDPFNVPRSELTFLVKSDNLEKSYNIEKVYEDLVTSTAMHAYVSEKCGIDDKLNELISLERTSYGEMQGSDTVRVSIMHNEEEVCQAIAEAVVEYVEQQAKVLQRSLGSHEIALIGQSFGTVVSTDIMAQQRNWTSDIANMRNTAVKLKDAFTDEEWYYYNYLVAGKAAANPDADLQEEEETESDGSATGNATDTITVTTPGISVKFVILGMILFAFLYVFVFFMLYIMNNKLRVVDNLQEMYCIPQLGVVSSGQKKKKFLGVIDQWILKLRYRNQRRFTTEEAINLASVAAKMAVKKQGLSKICLMGCNLTGASLNVCEQIKKHLAAEGISAEILSNVLYDAEVMEELADVRAAVLVETVGSTLYDEIVRELELLNRQNILVLGGVVVEK